MIKDIVVSLYDYTGNMVKPWVDAGYKAILVDIQHDAAEEELGFVDGVMRINRDLTKPFSLPDEITQRIAFVAAFPPCDHLAVSGARWFKGKGLRALSVSIAMFATAADFCEEVGAPYIIENPVSTISTYWRKPDHTFHPHQFTGFCADDNYTKKTCLWVGNGFVMPSEFKDTALGEPDDRIHKAPPGPDRHNFRSATAMGFAIAVWAYNDPVAI